ncbi:hypothetical protein [Streptomyces sp. AcH 505]|uniref:hypothetical protein n=1 Tax=Streptomyces sp. AcH 505 TaxID=352211 RepID=UPI0007C87C15
MSSSQKAGRASVRQRAQGMTHHQVAAALDEAKEADGPADDERGSAEIAEWERIEELLADHDGPYDPDSDPFVQGELTARAGREAAESKAQAQAASAPETPEAPAKAAPAPARAGSETVDAENALRSALIRTGALDSVGPDDDTVVRLIAGADPGAALALTEWLVAAYNTGRAGR